MSVDTVTGSNAGSRRGSASPPGKKRAVPGVKIKFKVSSPPAPGSPLAYVEPVVGNGASYSPSREDDKKS
jgi:hypothetical protein